MKTIQLQIEDDKFNDFMVILKNLKEDFIKKFIVKDEIEFIDENEQKYYENLLQNMTKEDKEVSSKEIIEI
jgi:hypothetical protein